MAEGVADTVVGVRVEEGDRNGFTDATFADCVGASDADADADADADDVDEREGEGEGEDVGGCVGDAAADTDEVAEDVSEGVADGVGVGRDCDNDDGGVD